MKIRTRTLGRGAALCLVRLGGLLGLVPGIAWAVEPAANYGPVCEPQVKPAFQPLPLGSVQPTGWLRDWAVSVRRGITGHLDEKHPVFADAWKGFQIKAPQAEPDGTGWPLEQSAYWMDGALRLGFVLHDEALIQKVRARLDPIVDGVLQAEPGTSFIYWKKGYKPEGFNSWAHSQLGRAMVALYQGTGDPRVLDALVKVYADYPVNMGGLDDLRDVSGLCNLDPMMETYALSGDVRILERAKAAFHQAKVQAVLPAWADRRVECGHMVITYEDIRLPAVMYPWTGNPAHLQATAGAFRWIDRHHLMPYGLASGEEFAAGIGAGRKTETCNIPAMLLSANWMYRIEGDGAWGDRMEKVFFNAGPAPLARDVETAAYYQAPNRIRLGMMPVESPRPGQGGIAFGPLACRNVLCCIGACNRILPYFIANMWMATGDRGLAATLYGPCTVNALAGPRVPVTIVCTTDYPFTESIHMRVDPEKTVKFPLYVRLPDWCAAPVVEVNGKRIKLAEAPGQKGFARIVRRWRKGDIVELKMPMTVHLARGLEGAYPLEARGYFYQIPDAMFLPTHARPYASVTCGPLLFALPIPEKDPNTPVDGARWQYALDVNPGEAGALQVTRTAMPAHWDWPLAAPVTVAVPVRSFDWKPTSAQALPEAPVPGEASETVTLVPYGCTKFHISMFPVTPHAWEGEPLPEREPFPETFGGARLYPDDAATKGFAAGYIDMPGAGVVWRHLPAGKQLKLRYAALNKARLTLQIQDGLTQKVEFSATGKWQGPGAYAEVIVPITIPDGAVVRLVYEAGDVPANIDSAQVVK